MIETTWEVRWIDTNNNDVTDSYNDAELAIERYAGLIDNSNVRELKLVRVTSKIMLSERR